MSLGARPLNHLLAALPPDVYERLLPHLELVPLELGASVYEAGGKQAYVYFPTDSIVSLLYVMKDGASAEIAVVGNEGLVGISLFMGGETTPSRAVVQSAGRAYRLRAKLLKAEFEFGGALQHLLLRYTQALITQMAQTAVCNRHHSIEQQLCRWLLLSADRLPDQRAHDDAGPDREHARRAARRRHGRRREAAGCRPYPLQPRPHHDPRSSQAREARVRVLRGRQERIRSSPAERPCERARSVGRARNCRRPVCAAPHVSEASRCSNRTLEYRAPHDASRSRWRR